MSAYYYEVGSSKSGGWLFFTEESGQAFPKS